MSRHPRYRRAALRAGAMHLALGMAAALVLAVMPATAQQNRPPPTVKVSVPLTERINDWDEYTGRFIPVRTVQLQSRISGYLDRVDFREGDIVTKGQVLFQIDPRPFEAELASARARMAAAEARRDVSKTDAERALTLFRRKVGSEQDFQRAQGSYAETVANVAIADAAIRSAELNLEFTRITAPITGRISATGIDPGNLVAGGLGMPQVLATIVSMDPIEFSFTASEANYLRYIRLARSGERASARQTETPVQLRLMDEDTWTYTGRMTFVDNRLDPNSGTIEGRATFANPDLFLTPGVFGRMRLPASGTYTAMLVPDDAILSDQSRKIVYVVADDDTVSEREVTMGPLYRGLRVIRKGLEPQERIVVSGIQRAKPGAPVTPEDTVIEFSQTADG